MVERVRRNASPCPRRAPGRRARSCPSSSGRQAVPKWERTAASAAAPPMGAIGQAAVNERPVVNGDLSGAQNEVGGAVFLFRRDRYLLIDAQEVALRLRFAMLPDATAMRSRQHAHTAVLAVAIVHGVPDGERRGRFQSPIGHVLVPGDKFGVLPVLAEEVGGKQQDIRTDQALHAVQDFRARRQLPDERLVEVAVQQPDLRLLASFPGLQLVEESAVARGLRLLHNADTGKKPFALIGLYLLFRQQHCKFSSQRISLPAFLPFWVAGE